MNDRNARHHRGEPAWPTGEEPGAAKEQQERTGFWSPLWEDDDDPPAARSNPGHAARQPARPEPQRTTQMRRPGPPNPGAAPTIPVRPPGRPGHPAAAGPTTVLPSARQPRDNSQDVTEHLPPVPGAARREPDLLTHREGEYDEDDFENEHRGPSDEELRRRRRKKIWRRVRRTAYVFTALMIIGPVLAFLIAYQMVDVPTVEDLTAQQTRAATLKYADGSPMAQIVPQDGERRIVRYDEIPPQVLNAVFAAEDNTFMTNPGFDITGVMGAAWNQVTGGTGGGSGITQQYVKQSTGNSEKTLSRKALEVVQAYKMNRTYSKEDIITAYLNTIYLGRASYGIASAAKAWYGKDLQNITPQEAALLAGVIQLPGRYQDMAYVEKRWNYVMDQMVANGWFPAEQRKTEKFPTPVPYEQTKAKKDLGPRGLLETAVLRELKEKAGLDKDDILAGGYTIETTINPTAQKLAEEAVAAGTKNQPENLRPALVAVDPKTGAIQAYYGGADGIGIDWAATRQEPGSTWKPFDLVALLKTGKGLGEVYDSSVNKFPGVRGTIANASRPGCKECTVAQAMKESLNTVFFNITLNTLNPKKVADAAREAGVLSPLKDNDVNMAIGGGDTQVSTVDMASAYATFAARGTYRAPHIVSRVLTPDGGLYWQAQEEERPAFDTDAKKNAQIARNVTEALIPIPAYSQKPCADGRLCAAKTGTHEYEPVPGKNSKAWMVGYTPQISTAVSLSGTKEAPTISDVSGGNIFGARVPGTIWKTFMDSYHKTFKLKKEDFGAFDPIGKESSENATGSSTSRRQDGDNGNGNRPTTTTTDPQGPTTTTTTRTRPTRPTIPTIGDPPDPGEANNSP